MALTVTMPQLGESVTEGTIARWLKHPGDSVGRYESIAEVVTDKVNAEIPSPAEGVMGDLIAEEGAVVAVGQPICTIEGAAVEAGAGDGNGSAQPEAVVEAPGGGAEMATTEAAAEAAAPLPASSSIPEPSEEGAAPSRRAGAAAATAGAGGQPPRRAESPAPVGGAGRAAAVTGGNGGGGAALHLTPAVRMLAREHGVDLAQLRGSGIGGRITKKDVLEFVQQRDAGVPAAAPAPAPAPVGRRQAGPTTPAPLEVLTEDRVVGLTPARRAIAEHMVRSRHTSPHAWVMVEVDMTGVARARDTHRADFRARTGAHLTFLPFVAQAAIAALRRHPTLNASFSDEGIVLRHDINLGIAIALDDNLIVPVIRNADRLSMSGLAAALGDMVARARAGRLRIDELQGGTFTLNNAGALRTVMSQAIINQPQAAIMVMDGIVRRPVVVEGDAIAIRSMMNLSVSFDHRINDGLQAARFLNAVKDSLEAVSESSDIL